jgi:hypothetical protein
MMFLAYRAHEVRSYVRTHRASLIGRVIVQVNILIKNLRFA